MRWNLNATEFLKKVYRHKPLLHLLYWAGYIGFFGVVWGSADFNFKKTFTIELIGLPISIAVVYFTIYVLMPKLLFEKKVYWFFFALFAVLIIAVVLQRYIDNYIVLSQFLPDFQKQPILNPIVMLSTAFKFVAVLALPVTIRFMNYASDMNRLQQQLKQQKLEAELSSLKNQIQPHFLFNTLNSLYSLILKKSDKAVQVVLRLSELLRYVLYESENSKIALSKEIEFIRSYVELEQIRLGSSARIEMEICGNTTTQFIAPLLIMPFVENAVKHVSVLPGKEIVISIEIKVDDNLFQLIVKNPATIEASPPTLRGGGIGLTNVRKRLELLYPGRHNLHMERETDWFYINLSIEL